MCLWITPFCNALQRTATHCNALQRTATHCNALQCTAMHCNTLQHIVATATHCNTLQHTATHCNTLQHTATHGQVSTAIFELLLDSLARVEDEHSTAHYLLGFTPYQPALSELRLNVYISKKPDIHDKISFVQIKRCLYTYANGSTLYQPGLSELRLYMKDLLHMFHGRKGWGFK